MHSSMAKSRARRFLPIFQGIEFQSVFQVFSLRLKISLGTIVESSIKLFYCITFLVDLDPMVIPVKGGER
jgi:hypothetical protein